MPKVAALIIGMAGSGKTTLVQQMHAYLSSKKRTDYLINLDPAVKKLPYEPNVDIRDTCGEKPSAVMPDSTAETGKVTVALRLFMAINRAVWKR